MALGTLYTVATPIGNLGDVSPRAREVLASVDLVAGESEASTLRLLRALNIVNHIVLYQEANRASAGAAIVRELQKGRSVALVSEAGTPGVSDPGRDLVERCHEQGIPVRTVPGPSALTAALSVAGLPARRVAFEGFVPRKSRRAYLEDLRGERRTMVFFEAPSRVRETVQEMLEIWGDRRACLARELTKLHEEVVSGTLSSLLLEPDFRGECVLVVTGAPDEEKRDYSPEAARLLELGLGVRTASEVLQMFTPLGKSEAYRLCLEAKGN